MAKTDVEVLTEEKISKGGVLAKLYFDMQNEKKESLQPLLADLINERLMKEKGIVYCYGTIEEPIESKDGFVTSAIVTILVENFFTLVGITFNYSPAGIEILKPTKNMSFRIGDLQSMLMDLSQISMNYSKYVLERVLKPEDLARIREQLNNRTAIGKRMLEKKEEKGSG